MDSGSLCQPVLLSASFHAIFKGIERGDGLKISIEINSELKDTEITISCQKLTPRIEKILQTLRILDCQMTVFKGGELYILDISKIVYIEAVERKTFVYTETDVYETKLKLYELEEQLCGFGFFRISKSCMVQLQCIQSLKAELNRRIRLTLETGEQIIVSRQYAEELKKRLGVN